jgi:putative chitinase
MLTRAELGAVMPLAAKAPDAVVAALDAAMRRFGIDTPARMAAFCAQLAHESGQLQRWTENLSYRWPRLRQVFPKYFPSDADARPFDRQPERIANRVYANRMGNGPETSGDGWRYRGRGPIQLTGKANYRACGEAIGVDLVADPDLLATPEPGCLAAAWFWARNGLNALADAGDFVTITRRINGGLAGLAERREFWERAKSVFGVPEVAAAEAGMPVGARRPAPRPRRPRKRRRRQPAARARPRTRRRRPPRPRARRPASASSRRGAPVRRRPAAPRRRRRRAGS